MKKLPLLCIACVALSSFAFSQNRSWQAGIKLTGELTLYNGLAPGAGVQLIYRGKKNAGFETGLLWQYRNYFDFFIENPGEPHYKLTTDDHRLQIPLLYRNHGKVLNFSAGPVIDIYLGSSTKSTNITFQNQNEFGHYPTRIAACVAFSHTFQLKSGWIIEPALSANWISINNADDDGGLGIHVSFRKKIR